MRRTLIHIPLRLREIEQHAEEMKVTLNYAVGARRRYLERELDFWLESKAGPVTWAVMCVPRFWAIVADLMQLQRDLFWKNKPAQKGDITDEMKQQAREYPVERLIEFDHQGKAFCLWHDDQRPSMMKSNKKNGVRCYVCNKGWDPIDIVMKRDGKNYFDAVRHLCNSGQ
jgi:hypothetical protein